MNTRRPVIGLLVSFIAGVVLVCVSPVHSSEEEQPIVVLVEKTKTGTTHKIGAKLARSPDIMLEAFRELFEKRGRESVVLVLVDDHLSINEFERVSGIAGKIGFVKFRYFTFGHDDT